MQLSHYLYRLLCIIDSEGSNHSYPTSNASPHKGSESCKSTTLHTRTSNCNWSPFNQPIQYNYGV